jgi:hypothetical protein
MPIWAIKLCAGLALAAALLIGYNLWASHQQGIGEARATGKYNVKIAAQKVEAAALLAKETARVTTTEKALQAVKNNQEVQDAKNRKTVAGLTARLRDLAVNGRLRDPNAGRGGSSDPAPGNAATSPGDSADHGAETGGVLSGELTGFLLSQAASADEINLAYISCREDAAAVRATR